MIEYDELQLKFELDLDEIREDADLRVISYQEAQQISAAARMAFDQLRLTDRDDAGRGWFDDYLKLVEQGWPWRVACYLAWASSPKTDRWPKTIHDMAVDVLNLKSPRVIYTWRKKYPTIDTVVAMLQAAPLWEHRRDVLEALAAMAKDHDYKAFNDRKLFLEMVGDYVPKSVLELGKKGPGGIEKMSDDELRKWAGEEEETPLNPPILKNKMGGGKIEGEVEEGEDE